AGLVQKDDRGKPMYDRRVAERHVLEELKVAGRSIDGEGLRRLVDAAGDEISKLRDDLGRLLLYTQGRTRITAADVAEVTSGDERVLLERLVVELTGRALPASRGWGGRGGR